MARDLITPVTLKKSGTTTAMTKLDTKWTSISTANGAYITTTGIDATKVIFLVDRSSGSTSATGSTGAGTVTIVAGSTAGNEDYSATGIGNLGLTNTSSTAAAADHIFAMGPLETARFKDTDEYIKLNYSTAMAKGRVAALLLP